MRTPTPSHQQLVDNILAVYAQSTADERIDGTDWYPCAYAIVQDWAREYDRTEANIACVIAALSPQVSWERCLITAGDLLAGRAPSVHGCLNANLRKAERILVEDLETPLNKYPTGPKVSNFALNLQGLYGFVTVDTHAAQIAAGDVRANLVIDRFKPYELVAVAYRVAAEQRGILPAEIQAITWLTWKRLFTPAEKRTIRRRRTSWKRR